MDIVAWLLGPAGIVLGWWLNQRSLHNAASREAEEARSEAERQRVLTALVLARDTAGQIRSLLHGIHLKQRLRRTPSGFDDAFREFNESREHFQNATLSLRVQGPSWAVGDAERIDLKIGRLAELGQVMQEGITAEHMDTINAELPELERTLIQYVSAVSARYNADAPNLPPQPDREKDGRWRPEA